jgi:hypothetical protein
VIFLYTIADIKREHLWRLENIRINALWITIREEKRLKAKRRTNRRRFYWGRTKQLRKLTISVISTSRKILWNQEKHSKWKSINIVNTLTNNNRTDSRTCGVETTLKSSMTFLRPILHFLRNFNYSTWNIKNCYNLLNFNVRSVIMIAAADGHLFSSPASTPALVPI